MNYSFLKLLIRMKHLSILVLLVISTTICGCAQTQKPNTIIFPAELEKEIALSALPEHLREDCGIYLFNPKKGFELVKESKNGHTTMVQRIPGMNDAFVPVSYDNLGQKHHVKRILDIGRWIAEGVSPEEIRERVKSRYENGTYLPPSKLGISYMLSPLNMVPRSPLGRPALFPPHYMVYAPNYEHKDLGLPDFDWHSIHPNINNIGPHGNLIFKIGEKETEAIKRKHKDLMDRVEKYLGRELSYHEVPK